MSDIEIQHRIRRIESAMNVVHDKRVERRKPEITFTDGLTVVHDFTDGKSQVDLENDVFALITQIAHLYDHLRKFIAGDKDSSARLEKWRGSSRAVCLLYDLANSEKHGGKARNSLSGKNPQLRNLDRAMRLTCGGNGSTFVTMTLGPNGEPVVSSDGGGAAVITTGEIIDSEGNHLGELSLICREAIDDYDVICKELGIPLR